MDKRWVITETDELAVDKLYRELKINRVLCELLVKRGIYSYEEAERFFRPDMKHLHDPFLMKDMDLAVERIDEAIRNNEKVMVYGDYDVDGTTAVALVFGFLREVYFNIEYYIPDRYREGYGISYQGIDHAVQHDIKLVIALDCGIKAVDQVRYANERGIDFIICDHHRPGDVLPPAVAVLDPKREDCTYPYTELSGCGIGFKLAQALAVHMKMPDSKVESQLDLVVVSIAADIVPITGENRILAYYGLKRLNKRPRPGLRFLLRTSGVDRKLNISDIIFVIGPRINAAGRMDHGNAAVRLLTSQDSTVAQEQAENLNNINTRRRLIDRQITQEALDLIEADKDFPNRKATVLYQAHWHKGVIGIVASRMIENYYRPTIILTSSDDRYAAGSARSVKNFDIYNAIGECEDLLEQFGGHKYAAGLTIEKERIPEFMRRFEAVVAGSIKEREMNPEVTVDAEVPVHVLDLKFYSILSQFEPFGPANTKPSFVSRVLRDTGNSEIVGQRKGHIKVSASQIDSYPISGIGFNMAEKLSLVKDGAFDICYNLDLNSWRGTKNLQFTIKDVKASILDVVDEPIEQEEQSVIVEESESIKPVKSSEKKTEEDQAQERMRL